MKVFQHLHQFKAAFFQRSTDGRKALSMVNSAKRMNPPRCVLRRDAQGACPARPLQQRRQNSAGNARHIAACDHVPLGLAACERRFNPGQRSLSAAAVRYAGNFQMRIALRASYQSYVSGNRRHRCADLLYQMLRMQRQKRFVLPHPCAHSAYKDKTGGAHRQIVTFRAVLFRLVSPVSFTEIAIKANKGLTPLTREHVEKLIFDLDLTILPLTAEHSLQLFGLPAHHSDPFDRMLIAAALAENIPIVASDREFKQYKRLRVVW